MHRNELQYVMNRKYIEKNTRQKYYKTIYEKDCEGVEKKETLICTVESPATEEMLQQIQQGETAKEDIGNHGYGVRNIQRAVKRLNGESTVTRTEK